MKKLCCFASVLIGITIVVLPLIAGAETCEADLNRDGEVNQSDRQYFNTVYKAERGTMSCEDPCLSCPCPTGFIDCYGTCVDPMKDEDNCGGCMVACAFDETCIGGVCHCPRQLWNVTCEESNGQGHWCVGWKECDANNMWGPCILPDETCNGIDDNCDGQVDEGFDLANDPFNCGICGNVCDRGECIDGVCTTSLP